MNQTPGFNDPLIVIQVSPGWSEEALGVTLRKINGLSHLRLDSENMRVCMRSSMNPFDIVDEIRKVDAGAHLFQYNKEPAAPDVHPNRKSDPRNHKPRSNAKEDEDFEEDNVDKDRKHGQGNHRRQPEFRPNGYKQQEPNTNEAEDFEDVRDIPRNRGRNPNDCKERRRRNAMGDEGFESDQCHSSNDHKGKGYPRGYNYDPEEYVCRNYREDEENYQAPPKVSNDHDMFRNRQNGGFSRDDLRSQSCRFDERNSQQQPPSQSHYPKYKKNTRYGSPSDSQYARNSHYHHAEPHYHHAEPHYHHGSRAFDEPSRYDAPHAEPQYPSGRAGFFEENHHNSCSNMAPPSYDTYEQRGWGMPPLHHSDYPMGDPHGCNIL